MNNKAQGTIEYLVIIAVIVVLSLVVVALFVSMSNSPSQQILNSSNKLSNSSGGISIVESVTDLDGDSIVKLTNLSNDVINLTKISVDGTDNEYLAQLVGLDSKLFNVKSVSGGSCSCVSGQKTANCDILVEYTIPPSDSVYTIRKTITSQCVSNSTASPGASVIDPIDSTPPSVLLYSPEGTLDSRIVSFSFSATESNEIISCSINLSNGSSFPLGSVTSGHTNTLDHTFNSDLSFDWNVSCEDDSGNIGVSNSKHIDIITDTSPPVISLSSPADGNIFSGRNLIFDFSVTDDSEIASCTLNIGSDSNTYYNLNNGANTINYTKSGDDGLFDWNISCSDGVNTNTSDSRLINVDANAYQISYCVELQRMNQNLSGNYELMNNIDCGADTNNSSGALWNGGYGFNPIGSSTSNFRGRFNGNGYVIDSLYINRPLTSYIGLFGFIYQGGVSNLGLTNENITGYGHIGGIVGDLNTSSIINSYSTGKVKIYGVYNSLENKYVGGIAGLVYRGSISNSYSLSDVNGLYYTGGIVGVLLNGTSSDRSSIINSYYSGNVDGNRDYVGGIAGGLVTLTAISNCYSSGTVHARLSRAGGLVGDIGVNSQFSLSNSFSTSAVSVGVAYSGGLVGSALSTGTVITNSYWDKTLTGQNNCYYNGSTSCSFTTNTPSWYYSSSNAPLSSWTWGADGNWVTTATYPKLAWQN